MKILVLSATILNFVVYFPYIGSQEIHYQTSQYLSANLPLSSYDSHITNQHSSILRTKENSEPTDESNRYSDSTDTLVNFYEFSKRNYSETPQVAIYNFTELEFDAPTNQTSLNFTYMQDTVDSSTEAKIPKNTASPSSAVMQDMSAVSTITSIFVPTSGITQKRRTIPSENSISAPVSTTISQYKSNPTGRSKAFFAPISTAYIQNAKNAFGNSADEITIDISNANNFLGTDSTTHETEAGSDRISFIDTTTFMKEGPTENTNATDTLEDYMIPFDVPYLEDKNINIIDTTDLERYHRTVSNDLDLPQKDKSIAIHATDIKNDGRTTVNSQISSISSAKNSNDFESVSIPSTYDKADIKSIMSATAISNINPINTTNYFLNYRIYKKINNVISNSDDNKTMKDIDENIMHVGNLNISKTNDISTKQNVNPSPIEPITSTYNNYRIIWSSKEGKIMENLATSNDKNIAEIIASKRDDPIINYHSNIAANAHLKTNRNNGKCVNTYGTENGIPVKEEITNVDLDDGIVEEVIYIHPETFTTEIKRKIYSLTPNAEYAQTAVKKITFPPDIPNMFNPLFKYEINSFATGRTNLNNRGSHITPTTIIESGTKAKADIEQTPVLKRANMQSNNTVMVSLTHRGTADSIYFNEDSEAEKTSNSRVSITPSYKSDSVDEAISFSTNDNQGNGVASLNSDPDFSMEKGYYFHSVVESPTLIPNGKNNEDLLSKYDSLTSENFHPINNAILQNWKINEVSVDTLNTALESSFLTVDFTSSEDTYNATTSVRKGTTNMTDSSELMTSKTAMLEGKPTLAITFAPAKTSDTLIPRKKIGIGKEITNEEPTSYMETESAKKDDTVIQIKEDLLPIHNFKYSESENDDLEENGYIVVDSTKSLFQLNSIIHDTEITNESNFNTLGKEKFKIQYDGTKLTNDKVLIQPKTTKRLINGLGERAGMIQNVEATDGTEFLSPTNFVPQTGKMDYPVPPNSYYNVITDTALTSTKENSNIATSTMKHKLLVSTMDNANIIDYRDVYQVPAAITSNNANRWTNKGKMAETEITNKSLGITTVIDDVPYVDENAEVEIDFASIVATSPKNKDILTMNEVNTLNNKSNKLKDGFNISEDNNVSREDGMLLIINSSTFSPFNHPQATNPTNKASLVDIIMPKTFHIKSIPAPLTIASATNSQEDADTIFYIPRYEYEDLFKEETALNYEAVPPKVIRIMAKNNDILKEEDMSDHIYVLPIAGEKIPNGNSLAIKHYSINPDVYNPIMFKKTAKTTAYQVEFENPESSYMNEVSEPLHRKLIPDFQGNISARNSNSGADHEALFDDVYIYSIIKENVPKGYIFSNERKSTFATPDFMNSIEDNVNSPLEGTVLLSKRSSSKKNAPYIYDQTNPGTKKDHIAIDSITNSHTDVKYLISTPLSPEDINVENYYLSGTGTPLSLGYAKTLTDDYFVLSPGATLEKENNLDDMKFIIIELDENASEYDSNENSFAQKKENSPIKTPIQFIHEPIEFGSHTPFSKGETSKSFLYRIILPDFKTEEKSQTIILKGENSDSDIFATSFKDYNKNFNTQDQKTMVSSLTDSGEAFSPEFLEISSARKSTLSEDDIIINFPEVSDLGSKKTEYTFVPQTEINVIMEESRGFGDIPTDDAVITTPIKSKDHFNRKGISFNFHNKAILESADTMRSEKSKENEDKMDLAEVISSVDHINPLTQEVASQAKNISYAGEVTRGIIKTAMVTSLNPVNATRMPLNSTIISPSGPTFDSRESNGNGDSSMPEVNGIMFKVFKALKTPNQKKTATAVVVNENYDSLSDTSVAIEVSEPLSEYSTTIDPDWEITKMQSDPSYVSMVSSVPLRGLTTFSENSINKVTYIPTTENGGISDKTDIVAFAPNIVLQSIIHKNGGGRKTPDYAISHHVNEADIKPSTKEISTSGTETNAFLSKDKTVVEDEYISEANIPKDFRKENSVNIDPIIFKPDIASTEQKTPETSKEIFYPDSTMSATKLTKPRARSLFSPNSDNLERSVTQSYNKLDPLPLKLTLPTIDFDINSIKISNSKLDPANNIRDNKLKITDDSILSSETISTDNIIFFDDIINIERYVDFSEKDNIQHKIKPFTKDFSAESDVIFLAGEINPNNMDLVTTGIDDYTLEYVSEENTFYDEEEEVEEEKKPTTKISTVEEWLQRVRFPALFSTAHVTENVLKENSAESETKQKYQMLISTKGDNPFLKEYSTIPRTMTHSLTAGNRDFLPIFPDFSALKRSTLSGSDIIIPPEDEWIETTHAPDPESMNTLEESWTSPGKITDITISSTALQKDQLHRKGISSTAFYVLRESRSTMPPKSEYNLNKNFKAENFHSKDVTESSVTFKDNLDNALPFVDEDSMEKHNETSASSSPVKTIHTMADITALSIENRYERNDSMQPDKNNVSGRKFPLLLTTGVLRPKDLIENSVLMSNNYLNDSSKSMPVVSETVIGYLDLINRTNMSENQDNEIQTDLQPHTLDSIIPFTNLTNFIRNPTDDEADSPSTTERDSLDISEVKTDVQPLNKIMKVHSLRQINPFPSEIGGKAKPSAEEDTADNFSTLEKTVPSTPDPSTLPKSNEEEDIKISKAGNFVIRGSRILKDNSFFGNFTIPARPQDPPSLQIISSAISTVNPEDINSASLEEGTGTAGLPHDVPTGSYEDRAQLLWGSTLTPSDFKTFVSSSRYYELDPVVNIEKDTTIKTNNNIPFEEENIPFHKSITSQNTNTSTKNTLKTIFNKRFVHRNLVAKDTTNERKVLPITENISDFIPDDENILNNEDVIITVFDDYVTNEYVLEPQEEKNNLKIKKSTFSYEPQILGSHPFNSSSDTSEHLYQGSPVEIQTKELLINFKFKEGDTNPDFDAIVFKSPIDNLSSKAPRSMTHPLTHTSGSFHNFLDTKFLQSDSLSDDNSIILPEDKSMEDSFVADSEIVATMVEGTMFSDELINPIMFTSLLKNKRQFLRKDTSPAIYNTDAQGKAEKILSRIDEVKGKTNMAEMPYLWDSLILLNEFNVTPDSKLSFINENTEILNNGISVSSPSMNTVYSVIDTTFSTDNSGEKEDNMRSRGILPLKIPENPMLIPNASNESLKISDPLINSSLESSSISWSDMFEIMTEYPNSINYSDVPIKNKIDLKPYSITSMKFPIDSSTFSDDLINNEFDSQPYTNRQITDISKIETDKIYPESQRINMKAVSPRTISQHRVYEEREIGDLSGQEDSVSKFELGHITTATVLSTTIEKILSSVTEPSILSESNNNVEEEVHIYETGNFFPKDASTPKNNLYTVKLDATFTKPQAPPSLKINSSVDSTLILPETSRSNDQSSSSEIAFEEGAIKKNPAGIYGLLPWKSTLSPSDFTTFKSSSEYSELDPVVKIEKDITTKANNNTPPGERNVPSDKAILSSIIISTNGMKNPISNKFGYQTFIEKNKPTEVISFIENISEEIHNGPLFVAENTPNNEDTVIVMSIDSALEDLDYVADNYIFELMEDGNSPSLTRDSNVSESHAPNIRVSVSEHLSQRSSNDMKTSKKYQGMVSKEENHNSDKDAIVPTTSTMAPSSMIYSLTDSSGAFSPEFLDETIKEHSSLIGVNTIIILLKDKRMEYPLVSNAELMTTGEGRIFTTESSNPAIITNPIEYKDEFNRKGALSAFYAPDETKSTLSVRFDANKHKPNLAYRPYSENNVVPLAEFSAILDGDLSFISKDTGKTTRPSSPMNTATSLVADSIVLSTERSYEGSDSTLSEEDNVNSKGFSSLLTSGMLITNSLTENPDTSVLFSSSEILERATEYADTDSGGDVSERQIIIQAVPPYILAGDAPPIRSTTFSDNPTDGVVDSFFFLNSNNPENYKIENEKNVSQISKSKMQPFSSRKDSQNTVYETRKIANLFDQEDPTAKFDLSHYKCNSFHSSCG